MKNKMNKVIEILMERDGESYTSAKHIFDETQEEILCILGSGGGYDEVEDVLYCNLGLEMDYIYEFL